MAIVLVHYASGLATYWWSPVGHVRLDTSNPYLWLFFAAFTLGQVLIWFLAARWSKRRVHA
jgi:hypothetical protein